MLKIRFPNIGPTYRTRITSSNGHIFSVTGQLCGEFTGDRWISHTKASDAELWCFPLICALYKRLSKWPWGWWFETPRAHYDVTVMVSGKSTASNTTKTLCYNAWNSNFEYPNILKEGPGAETLREVSNSATKITFLKFKILDSKRLATDINIKQVNGGVHGWWFYKLSQIAKLMGQHGAHLGPIGPRWVP